MKLNLTERDRQFSSNQSLNLLSALIGIGSHYWGLMLCDSALPFPMQQQIYSIIERACTNDFT